MKGTAESTVSKDVNGWIVGVISAQDIKLSLAGEACRWGHGYEGAGLGNDRSFFKRLQNGIPVDRVLLTLNVEAHDREGQCNNQEGDDDKEEHNLHGFNQGRYEGSGSLVQKAIFQIQDSRRASHVSRGVEE
jgi:hypothetical protein